MTVSQTMRLWTACILAAAVLAPTAVSGMDYLAVKHHGQQLQLSGRFLVKAQDGGRLLLACDGQLWPLQPDEIVSSNSDDKPFIPLDMTAIGQRLLSELPRGFDTFRTAHYLICFNTGREYAQWCGSLFEQLYRAFENYWTRKGFTIKAPEFPLVAIIFADRRGFVEFARAEVGDGAASIIGYYSLQTNRMTMCDLTGVESFPHGKPRTVQAQINAILAQPDADRTVATIVHEATHQIAFNCGLHTRLSDCPLWFTEGIAVYFETPNLSSDRGWRNIGAVNRPRLEQFQRYLRTRPADSLEKLIATDERLRDTKQGLDAYAEAWALTYFLLRQYPQQYVKYLEGLSRKKPMVWDAPEARLAEFRQAFGDDLARLDQEFIRYMLRVR